VVRCLALANRERGTDGLGFFDNHGTIAKDDGDPALCLAVTDEIRNFFNPVEGRWFVAGHTRWSTRGKDIKENCHPFKYGRVIGSHNGVVPAPSSYTVDSEFLFDLLELCDNDYQAALGDVGGSFALTWSFERAFYLLAHKNPLHLAVVDNNLYYSSDKYHLAACLNADQYNPMREDSVIKFTMVDGHPHLEALPDFESKAPVGFYVANWQEAKKDGENPCCTGGEGQGWPDGQETESGSDEQLFDAVEEDDDVELSYWDRSETLIEAIEEYDAKARTLGYRNLDDLMELEGLPTLDCVIDFIDSSLGNCQCHD
jgi:hypothetical protein